MLVENNCESFMTNSELSQIEQDGYVTFVMDDSLYFFMSNDRQLKPPASPGSLSTLSNVSSSSIIAPYENDGEHVQPVKEKYNTDNQASSKQCYTAGVCSNLQCNNNTVLCDTCFELFIRNGIQIVDFKDNATCDDCTQSKRAVRVHSSGRQLCIECFNTSLQRIRSKKTNDSLSTVARGVKALFDIINKP